MRQSQEKIVFLRGGLGNQLFQYVYGVGLRNRLGFQVRFDRSYFSMDSRHGGFVLDQLGFKDDYRDPTILGRVICKISYRAPAWVRKLFGVHVEGVKSIPVREARYLLGYWQGDVDVRLVKEFLLSSNVNHQRRSTAMRKMESVTAIHIRRGDYLLPENTQYFGVCSEGYYREAIRVIMQNRRTTKFVFFTDDQEWVAEKFSAFLQEEEFEIAPKADALEDFLLISCAANLILSNSTFSWWAALLNERNDCTVIAPTPWLNADTDFNPCLSEWIRLGK